jgi:Lysophospholipase L1 and related esterases
MLISFLLIMLAVTLVLFAITRLEVGKIGRNHYLQRVSFFEAHPAQKGDIIFLGDSLTAGGNWDELFPGLPIKNRGINADTTSGVLARLDCLIQGQPAAVFILIGTNDLPWYEYHDDETILQNYRQILEKIKLGSPHTRLFVESIFPRAHLYAERVRGLNARLQALAESQGATYIDIYSRLADANGDLRADLNNDHLHLLAAGYQLWAEALAPHLKTL